ncbi:TonB-dependent receptor [Seonamhaeicola sp.]|uniref:SusC/RagA family TonB-linked outer membrane protein n=1 Tax=Seonamhaeicola sp. TaxID=1912245 RepID=UPI002635FDB6|nr:TonB-dependent receptor [Seonamhaeicola sp.]
MKIKLLLILFCLFGVHDLVAQQTINGTITSPDKSPLPGASIVIKGTTKGVQSDFDGGFTLEASVGDTLVISYIGFETKEIIVTNDTTYKIELQENLSQIDEVVVIGYGSQKKSDLTGSVGSVKSEDLLKVSSSSNPLQALQGRLSGVQVLSASGAPGSAPVVRVRGVTTVNNNNPTYVVDGVILQEGISLDFLNANDIESMEVLKDASATAIFGSRGSNGVIIVTTKQGKEGKPRFNITVESSFESVANKIDLMNGQEFGAFVNEINPRTYNNVDALPNVDWQDLLFQDLAPIQNINASFSGASNDINYYVGAGYYSQEGIVPESGVERVTARLNTVYNLNKNLKIGLNFSIAASENETGNNPGISEGLVQAVYRAWPVNEPYNPDGSFAPNLGSSNVFATLANNNREGKELRSVANVYIELKFLKDFTLKTSLQKDILFAKFRSFTPAFSISDQQENLNSLLSVGNSERTQTIVENTLAYNKELGKHNVSGLLGFTSQLTESEFWSGSAQDLLSDDENLWYLSAGDVLPESVSSGGAQNSQLSFFARANYSFDSKYLLTATIRRDGSSKFPNNKWGTFPSVAAGWNIDKEPFLQNANFISSLKLRGSWGIVGNDKVNDLAAYSTISNGIGAVFGTSETYQNGAAFSNAGNPNLKWEETEQLNFGLDFGFFNGKLSGQVDYYEKTTDGILVPLAPLGTEGIGFTNTIFFNTASVENKGIELGVNWRETKGDFNYEIGFNASKIDNEVLDLGEGIGASDEIIGGRLVAGGYQLSRTRVGQSIGFLYGYKVAGVFQNTAELSQFPRLAAQGVGDFIYEDVNGDVMLTTADQTEIGQSIPDFVYGFNGSVGYKNVRLSFVFDGQYGNEIFNAKKLFRFNFENFESSFLNRWTGEGSTNEHPRASSLGVNYNASDYFVEDASFLRLRTLELSYSLPELLSDKLKIGTARIYVRGNNLFTITDYSGYSPEIGANNAVDGVLDQGIYPVTKVYTVGVNVTF